MEEAKTQIQAKEKNKKTKKRIWLVLIFILITKHFNKY